MFPLTAKKHQKNANKNNNDIVVNNEHTKYALIPQVCAALGWRTSASDSRGHVPEWDVYWTDYGLGIERVVRRAQSFQRVNHIPGMINIYRKNNLARALGRMQKLFGEMYEFVPQTWILPHDYVAVKEYLVSKAGRCIIVKPAGSAQGKGIYLVLSPAMIHRSSEEMIAQAYVMRPLTIEKKKFDMRVYALVTSVEPLRILVYKDGLVRLCTTEYSVPDENNVYESYMHLTNYAVNKSSSNFVQSNGTADSEDRSNKRSIVWLWKWLNAQGVDHRPIWRGICDIVVKTLLSTQAYLSRAYGACKMSSQNKNPFTCFEILGFDVILTDTLEPVLLEVNHTPSFRMDSKLDERIKTGLVTDTMRLLNVDARERARYYVHKAAVSQVRRALPTSPMSRPLSILHQPLPVPPCRRSACTAARSTTAATRSSAWARGRCRRRSIGRGTARTKPSASATSSSRTRRTSTRTSPPPACRNSTTTFCTRPTRSSACPAGR